MYLKIKVLALSIHELGVTHCTEENNTPKPRVVIGTVTSGHLRERPLLPGRERAPERTQV
jgi:hypothetical protein